MIVAHDTKPTKRRKQDRQPVVYLLHFSRRFKHAGHYTGTTYDLNQRLADHESGMRTRTTGLLIAARSAGITWEVSRTWDGSYAREIQLKKQGGASKRCPLCKANGAKA
jgi:predicted GIY-YIG superfamily endonuclease